MVIGADRVLNFKLSSSGKLKSKKLKEEIQTSKINFSTKTAEDGEWKSPGLIVKIVYDSANMTGTFIIRESLKGTEIDEKG